MSLVDIVSSALCMMAANFCSRLLVCIGTVSCPSSICFRFCDIAEFFGDTGKLSRATYLSETLPLIFT